MANPVIQTATCTCSFGAAPAVLTVTSQQTVFICKMLAATIKDGAPVSNVPTFGMCSNPANPTVAAVEAKIADLEGGVGAMLTSSGQAATFLAVFNICSAGQNFIAMNNIYGGSINLFSVTMARMGIEVRYISDKMTDEEVDALFDENTRLVFGETIANPALSVLDIRRYAAIAHRHGIPLVVDNTFGTPYFIRPIEHGADVVVHSATKFLGGHGTTLGGIIVDGGSFDWKASGRFPPIGAPNPSYHGVCFADAAGPAALTTYIRAILLRDTGAAISPFNAFLLLQGIETLSLRLDRHAENTRKMVEYLSRHPKVERVNHPSLAGHPDHSLYRRYFPQGGGSIFTVDLKGGQEGAFRFIDHLKLFSLLANVADSKSLVIHPATTTHAQLPPEEQAEQGILPGTVRLSIGTEHGDDLLADLAQALESV